jgi:hypothetical protein
LESEIRTEEVRKGVPTEEEGPREKFHWPLKSPVTEGGGFVWRSSGRTLSVERETK